MRDSGSTMSQTKSSRCALEHSVEGIKGSEDIHARV